MADLVTLSSGPPCQLLRMCRQLPTAPPTAYTVPHHNAGRCYAARPPSLGGDDPPRSTLQEGRPHRGENTGDPVIRVHFGAAQLCPILLEPHLHRTAFASMKHTNRVSLNAHPTTQNLVLALLAEARPSSNRTGRSSPTLFILSNEEALSGQPYPCAACTS